MTNDLAEFGAVAIGLIGTTIIAKETIKAVRQTSRQAMPRRQRPVRRQKSIADEFNLRI